MTKLQQIKKKKKKKKIKKCWSLKICVCLPRKYGRFMLLIDNNLLLPGAKLHILINIYRK